MERVELRFGIERIQVRGPARHAEVDHALRLCGEMQAALALKIWQRHALAGRAKQMRERHATDSGKAFLQESPTAEILLIALELVDERMLHNSIAGDGLVKVEHNPTKLRPCGEFCWVVATAGI